LWITIELHTRFFPSNVSLRLPAGEADVALPPPPQFEAHKARANELNKAGSTLRYLSDLLFFALKYKNRRERRAQRLRREFDTCPPIWRILS